MSILKFFRRRKMYATTYGELNRLSLRDLNDIGINPGDIRRLAREAAARA